MSASQKEKDPAIIELTGSYSDMGRQLGIILKNINFNPGAAPYSKMQKDIADRTEKLVGKHLPGIMDMLSGMADTGYDYDQLRKVPLLLSLANEPAPACTVFYLPPEYTMSGTPVFVRNYDWDHFSIPYYTKYNFKLTGGIENYSFSDVWFGTYGGVNKEGLCMAITAAPTYCGKTAEGIPMLLTLKWSLDHFKTCKEATDFLKSIPHSVPINFIVADRNGHTARVAATAEKIFVDQTDGKFFVQTNHYVNPEMEYLHDPKRLFPSTLDRYNNVHKWAEKNKGRIDLPLIEEFVKTPVAKNGIFDYIKWEGRDMGTIWSWYFDYEAMTLHYSKGKPDVTSFNTVSITG